MTLSGFFGVCAALVVLCLIGAVLRPRRGQTTKAPPLNDHLIRAEAWLQAGGYQIVRGRQEAEWIGYHDKDEFRKLLSVDFVVRQGADYYAVKVTHAPEVEVSGLRLREEWFPLWKAFGVKGIIHLDVLNNEAHTIDFEVKSPRYVWLRQFGYRSGWIAAGALMMFAWLHRN